MSIIIRNAVTEDADLISSLAEQIWWPTYSPILSKEQIEFMLDDMYSKVSLENQIALGMQFLILENNYVPKGFAGFTFPKTNNDVFKLHKLYLHPSEQGKGCGKALLEKVFSIAIENGCKLVELNVNRNNTAFEFYKSQGFEVYKTVDIPYYQFFLNDYVMRKMLG